jgi:hypothetical protein
MGRLFPEERGGTRHDGGRRDHPGAATMRRKLLHIYVNDHRAGAYGALALAARSWANNRGTALGDDLQTFIDEEREDRAELEAIMDRLRLPRDRIKPVAALAAERLGRLKLNGQIFGYSDLSRLVELDTLCLAVDAKIGLWRVLRDLHDPEAIDRLINRAEAQRKMLEGHRLEAARRAFDTRGV